jgi:hypothetical protein
MPKFKKEKVAAHSLCFLVRVFRSPLGYQTNRKRLSKGHPNHFPLGPKFFEVFDFRRTGSFALRP